MTLCVSENVNKRILKNLQRRKTVWYSGTKAVVVWLWPGPDVYTCAWKKHRKEERHFYLLSSQLALYTNHPPSANTAIMHFPSIFFLFHSVWQVEISLYWPPNWAPADLSVTGASGRGLSNDNDSKNDRLKWKIAGRTHFASAISFLSLFLYGHFQIFYLDSERASILMNSHSWLNMIWSRR